MFFDPLGPLRGKIVGGLMLMILVMVAIVMLGKLILYTAAIVITIRIALLFLRPRKAN